MDKTQGIKKTIEKHLKEFFETKSKKPLFKNNKDLKTLFFQVKDLTLRKASRTRALLFYYGYLAFSKKKIKDVLKLSVFFEVLQSYLLIHDDIIDKDITRRGGLSGWAYFYKFFADKLAIKQEEKIHLANSLAIVSGDLAAAWLYEIVLESGFDSSKKAEFLKEFSRFLEKVIAGQFLDVLLPYKRFPSKKEILNSYYLKTASYSIEAPLYLGAFLAGASKSTLKEISDFSKFLGVAFQIKDDISDIFLEEGSDLKEGKMTLLLYYLFKSSVSKKDKNFILSLKNKEKLTKKDIKKAREIFIKSLALQKTQKDLFFFLEKAEKTLKELKLSTDSYNFLFSLVEKFASFKGFAF